MRCVIPSLGPKATCKLECISNRYGIIEVYLAVDDATYEAMYVSKDNLFVQLVLSLKLDVLFICRKFYTS